MAKRYNYYEDGNTVRKVVEVPHEKPRKKKKRRVRVEKEAKLLSVKTISAKTVVLFAMLLVTSVISCINYLDVQSEIVNRKKEISSLESSIENVRAINDSMKYEIGSYIDVNYITKIAMEELGMVRASEGQIIGYDSKRNEYMEQYNDVPEK